MAGSDRQSGGPSCDPSPSLTESNRRNHGSPIITSPFSTPSTRLGHRPHPVEVRLDAFFSPYQSNSRQSSVAKYMVKRCGPPSQGWSTFLRNHAPDIAAMDLFVTPTIGFDVLYT